MNFFDFELVKQLKLGSEAAFEKVYYKYYKLVYHVVKSITNYENDVDDICQDTFINFYNSIDHLDYNQSIKYYLITIAKNLALKNLDKNIKMKQSEFNDDIAECVEDTESQNEVKYKNISEILKNKLSDEEVEIIVLHLDDGLKFKEIAEIKNTTIGIISSKYDRAIKK